MRTIFNQMNIIFDTFNATKRFVFHGRFGYDGNCLKFALELLLTRLSDFLSSETGIWVGIHGSIINDHADITVSPFFVQSAREFSLLNLFESSLFVISLQD